MSDDPRPPKRPLPPTSQPPDVGAVDSSWDDDTMPPPPLEDLASESAFDRVTAVPEIPAELYAKQIMAEGPHDSAPPESLPALSSEPPVHSLRPLEPLGSQPPPATESASGSDAAASTTKSGITARPGRIRRQAESEPSGLELAEMAPDTPSSLRRASQEPRRDTRDPMLELDLGDVVSSGPPPPLLLVSPPNSPRDVQICELKDRYAMGDFTGALVVAEGLLELDPHDIDAERYAERCRDVLMQMYSARLGALTQRVRVAVPGDQIRWLSLDHRAGFVLSLIDGSSSVEELLDISGMNRLDALRILYTLYDQRVIALTEH